MTLRKSLKRVLMDRDGMAEKEADDLITLAREDLYCRLEDGEMPFDICEEWFALEPDYMDEFI